MGQQYLENIDHQNVFPSDLDLKNLSQFDEVLPKKPSDPIATIDFLNRFGSSTTTASNCSRYFGFVIGAVTPAALGSRILTDSWNQCTLYQINFQFIWYNFILTAECGRPALRGVV